MNITILCTDPLHPVIPRIKAWVLPLIDDGHEVELIHDKLELSEGDLLFLVSCSQLINEHDRSKYQSTLVIHASDLPKGRGWSPHIWQILEGRHQLTVSLLEAEEGVDSGDIWMQRVITLEGHELYHEINEKLFAAELWLMDFAVTSFDSVKPRPQACDQASYYPKRTPADSELDPDKTLSEQFDLMRVCDPERYPAFFKMNGCEYEVVLNKRVTNES